MKPLNLHHIKIETRDLANHRLGQYSRNLDELKKQAVSQKNNPWLTYATIVANIAFIVVSIFLPVRNKSNILNTAIDNPHVKPGLLTRMLPMLRPNLRTENA